MATACLPSLANGTVAHSSNHGGPAAIIRATEQGRRSGERCTRHPTLRAASCHGPSLGTIAAAVSTPSRKPNPSSHRARSGFAASNHRGQIEEGSFSGCVMVPAGRPLRAAANEATSISSEPSPAPAAAAVKVKICGVTTPEDAALAVDAGASMVGMILWPKAKRSVTVETAAKIASTAREGGAEAVAVFVDEGAEEIVRVCRAAGIRIAQLHGDNSRSALPHLPPSLSTIFVLHANANGEIQNPLPTQNGSSALPDWILIDGLKGGSGEAFDWKNLSVPPSASSQGWILAGGLNPSNVASALSIVRPSFVDVSSGVAGDDGVKKDEDKVRGFVKAATSVAVQ